MKTRGTVGIIQQTEIIRLVYLDYDYYNDGQIHYIDDFFVVRMGEYIKIGLKKHKAFAFITKSEKIDTKFMLHTTTKHLTIYIKNSNFYTRRFQKVLPETDPDEYHAVFDLWQPDLTDEERFAYMVDGEFTTHPAEKRALIELASFCSFELYVQ